MKKESSIMPVIEKPTESAPSQPLVSICIPMYNDEKYVRRALDSAVNQTLHDIEIIVCDDASTDSSVSIVEEYAARDERIVLLRHERNMLPLEARRTTVNAARSEYLMFLDADDEYTLTACETCYNAAIENDADIVHFRMMFILTDGTRNIFTENYLAPDTKMLSGSGIIRNLLCADHLPGSHLVTKMWKRSVMTYAYEQIPVGQKIVWLEDSLLHFIALAKVSRYVGLDDELYKYYFGVGGTGQSEITLETVRKFLSAEKTFGLIQSYVAKEQFDEPMRGAALDASNCIRLGGICSYTKDILLRIPDDLFENALSLTLKQWPVKDIFDALEKYHPEQIARLNERLSSSGHSDLAIPNELTSASGVIALAEHYWKREEALAEELRYDRSLLPKTDLQNVKTIGMIYFGFWGGGIERVMSLLVDIYASMGIQTVLLIEQPPNEKDFKPSSEYERVHLPNPGSDYRTRADVLLESIKKYNIDLIISHVNPAHYVFWDALLLRSIQVPSLMYFHNTFALVLYDRKDIAWFLRQQAYFWPYDGMLVLSRVEGLYYRAIHDKVFVVPNPMTLSIPSTSIESVMQVDRPFEIVWLARLHMHYNYRDIPEIMSMVVEQEPNVHLNILANIPEGNPEFDSFVDEINARGLGDVITLKGYQSDITPFLEAADAHLLLSEMGGWAMTVAEAAAYGLPTVCYDLPWLELWRNSKGMLISASRDKRAVAQNITELIRDVSLKSRLSNEALEMAQILAILDYPTIWRRVFDQMILKRGSHSSENVDDRSDIVNVWGERYDISRDDDAQETAEIMVRTYNHFLEGCL